MLSYEAVARASREPPAQMQDYLLGGGGDQEELTLVRFDHGRQNRLEGGFQLEGGFCFVRWHFFELSLANLPCFPLTGHMCFRNFRLPSRACSGSGLSGHAGLSGKSPLALRSVGATVRAPSEYICEGH